MRLLACLLLSLIASACAAAPVQFSWTPPTTNIDGSPAVISGYRLYPVCSVALQPIPAPAAATSLRMELPAGQSCSASMSAWNSAGFSARSNTVQFVVPGDAAPGAVPGAVTNLRIAWREHRRVAGSVVFNGSTGGAITTDVVALTYPFTIHSWGKLDAAVNQGYFALFSQGEDANDSNIYIAQQSGLGGWVDDQFYAHLGIRVSDWTESQSTTNFASGTWRAVTAACDSSTSRRIFLDGGSKTTNTASAALPTAATNFTIGMRDRNTSDAYFPGKLAHTAVWSVALSDGQVASLGAGANPLTIEPESLIGYWPGSVIDISGTDYLEDVSGNENHMELFGGWSYDGADGPDVDEPPGGGADIDAAQQGVTLSTFSGTVSSSRNIAAALEAIQSAGSPAVVSSNRVIAGALESLLLVVNPALISTNRNIPASAEAIALTTHRAGLALSISAAAEQISLSTFLSVITSSRVINAALESIVLTAHAGSISVGSQLSATNEQIALLTNAAVVSLSTNINLQLQSIVLSQLSAQIGIGQHINAALESLTVSAHGATLQLSGNISAHLEALTLSTFDALIVSPVSEITAPGLGFSIAGDQMHYTIPVNKLHFTFRS